MNNFLSSTRNTKQKIERLGEYLEKFKYTYKLKSQSVSTENEEKMMDNQLTAINDLFKKLSAEIKLDLKNMLEETEIEKETNTDKFYLDARMKHWQALTRNLSNVINEYRSVQIEYNNEEKEKLKGQYLIANPYATRKQLEDVVNTEKNEDILKSAFSLQSVKNKKHIIERAKCRNESIKSIVKTINELCHMINEISEMTKGQGEMIDRIEVQISATKNKSEKTKEELTSGLAAAKRRRFWKRIFLVLIIIVILGFSIWGIASLAPLLKRRK
ncbi:t-SNARE complex subunit/syntaxin [Spraguea lophii 42_110]|uniref:t-SNARE complex subunit/syntaxin n=1 Tax=Spraguea lophii (strain 42_110) TaxID=1358809 RepID=S7W9J4_SPRLO|nr:t-SNARE complex subunit/syntaxin [Spraguea lophii 42_110]